jgi:protein-tyrosine kinase
MIDRDPQDPLGDLPNRLPAPLPRLSDEQFLFPDEISMPRGLGDRDEVSGLPARVPIPPEFDLGRKSDLRSVRVRLAAGSPLLPFAGENSQAAEQYRIIRTKIIQHPRRPRSIAVSSAASGDGKSVTAVNLAGVFAFNPEIDVLLIDGDLHRESLSRYFDVPSKPGLADVLSGTAMLREAIVRLDPLTNLYFLPGGKGQRGPADLLNSSRWRALSDALRRQFDYLVCDTPPAGALADFELIQDGCDGIVFVVRPDHTNRMLWMRACDSTPPDKLVGVIMNCVKPWFLGGPLGYYYQYYHYSKYYRR